MRIMDAEKAEAHSRSFRTLEEESPKRSNSYEMLSKPTRKPILYKTENSPARTRQETLNSRMIESLQSTPGNYISHLKPFIMNPEQYNRLRQAKLRQRIDCSQNPKLKEINLQKRYIQFRQEAEKPQKAIQISRNSRSRHRVRVLSKCYSQETIAPAKLPTQILT